MVDARHRATLFGSDDGEPMEAEAEPRVASPRAQRHRKGRRVGANGQRGSPSQPSPAGPGSRGEARSAGRARKAAQPPQGENRRSARLSFAGA